MWNELKRQGLSDDHVKAEMRVRFLEEDTPEVEVREQWVESDMAGDYVATWQRAGYLN